jgi:hypothetical protein
MEVERAAILHFLSTFSKTSISSRNSSTVRFTPPSPSSAPGPAIFTGLAVSLCRVFGWAWLGVDCYNVQDAVGNASD